jgi:hypothetical protein
VAPLGGQLSSLAARSAGQGRSNGENVMNVSCSIVLRDAPATVACAETGVVSASGPDGCELKHNSSLEYLLNSNRAHQLAVHWRVVGGL